MVEDVRQIFQDFLAPELRALAAQVKANSEVAEAQGKSLQNQVEAKGKFLQNQIDAQGKLFQSQFEKMQGTLETHGKLVQTQIEALTQRMEYLHRESMVRSDTLEQKLTARMDQIVQLFELEKRLARLESREAPG